MKKHYVTFLSPGTFFSETSTQEIDSWDVDLAVEMSHDIKERYGAKPYGFYFTTKGRGKKDFDSRQINESNMYYLGGEVFTLEQIEKMNNKNDDILIENMRRNKWDRVIINNNSWRIVQPFNKGDVVIGI